MQTLRKVLLMMITLYLFATLIYALKANVISYSTDFFVNTVECFAGSSFYFSDAADLYECYMYASLYLVSAISALFFSVLVLSFYL